MPWWWGRCPAPMESVDSSSSTASTLRLPWRRSSASRRVTASRITRRWVDGLASIMEHMGTMQTDDFLAELDRMVKDRLDHLGESAKAAEPAASLGIATLLMTALKKE